MFTLTLLAKILIVNSIGRIQCTLGHIKVVPLCTNQHKEMCYTNIEMG